jgi:hypothetical protein
MNHNLQDMAALAADVQTMMSALPGPQAISEHLMECREAECHICRGCAAVLMQGQQVN